MGKSKGKARNKVNNHRSDSWNDKESRDMRRDYKRREDKERDRSESPAKDRMYGLNDFSWYNKYPELALGAGRIPYPYRPGRTVTLKAGGTVSTTPFTIQIPGVMRLNWAPSFGQSTNVLSPVSIAAKELYSTIRSKFSSSLDADAPDLVVYLGALDSCYSYIGWLKRLYKLLDSYDPNNYAIPDALLISMGFSAANITEMRATKANLYTGVNDLIRKVSKFQMPNIMDLFKRHYWMNENVYTDAASMNSQFYVFDQIWYYKFAMLDTPVSGVKAGGLQMVARPGTADVALTTGSVVSDLLAFGNTLISALAESDDGYTISGYFMRAYEGTPVFGVELLGIDEMLNPIFQPEVLQQIENSATVLQNSLDPTLSVFSGIDVTQDPTTNTLLTSPTISSTSQRPSVWMNQVPISIRDDVPTVQDNFIATRLKAYMPYAAGDDAGKIWCGTELPINWVAYIPKADGTWGRSPVPSNVYIASGDTTVVSKLLTQLIGVSYKSQFDWSPLTTLFYANGTAGATSMYMFGDYHNVSVLDGEDIKSLHRVALYSELNAFDA